jgi:4-amino-4-deoxy-L-arabinose transferase-like glycosyltransferase
VYGGPFNSGYFNWHEFFALQHFRPAAAYFAQWLAVFVPTVLLALPIAAVWRRDTRTRELLALALWFLPITGLYLFVAFSYEAWTCLRYILPALPALILGGMLGVEALARFLAPAPARRLRIAAAVLLVVWAAGVSWRWSPANGVFLIKHYEDAYAAASRAVRAQLPANALVLCCHLSGALYFYTDFPILRWDALTPPEFARYADLAERRGVTMAALVFTEEEERALRESCPGAWTRLATVENIGIWLLGPPPALTSAR